MMNFKIISNRQDITSSKSGSDNRPISSFRPSDNGHTIERFDYNFFTKPLHIVISQNKPSKKAVIVSK